MLAVELHVGVIDGQIVASAGWQPGDDRGTTARISAVYVHPMFVNCGIGRRLVEEVEVHAARAGYSRGSVRSTIYAVPFFLKLGYDIASHGVANQVVADRAIPVAFMRKQIRIASGEALH